MPVVGDGQAEEGVTGVPDRKDADGGDADIRTDDEVPARVAADLMMLCANDMEMTWSAGVEMVCNTQSNLAIQTLRLRMCTVQKNAAQVQVEKTLMPMRDHIQNRRLIRRVVH